EPRGTRGARPRSGTWRPTTPHWPNATGGSAGERAETGLESRHPLPAERLGRRRRRVHRRRAGRRAFAPARGGSRPAPAGREPGRLGGRVRAGPGARVIAARRGRAICPPAGLAAVAAAGGAAVVAPLA